MMGLEDEAEPRESPLTTRLSSSYIKGTVLNRDNAVVFKRRYFTLIGSQSLGFFAVAGFNSSSLRA